MKGLELSKKFYNECAKQVFCEQFSDKLKYLAFALCGSGSECYGFDDELSQDHDFEPGFCIFYPDGVLDEDTVFALSRAYSRLPREFMGYKRSIVSPVGGSRHGVMSIGDFFEAKTGRRDAELSLRDWLSLPGYSLCEAVNGEVFEDNLGLLTDIRKKLGRYPEDVRLKKLAGNLLLMGQSGQYNYPRCVRRGDTAAAQLAAFEFVKSAIGALFLISNRYMPYYKWSFRALSELSDTKELCEPLEFIISSENSTELYKIKLSLIERICQSIAAKLDAQDIPDMEHLAYTVNNKIKDPNIRNMHILSGV